VLCDTALVCAFAEQKSRVDADLIHDVVRDKHVGGILPVSELDEVADDVVLDMHTAKKKSQNSSD